MGENVKQFGESASEVLASVGTAGGALLRGLGTGLAAAVGGLRKGSGKLIQSPTQPVVMETQPVVNKQSPTVTDEERCREGATHFFLNGKSYPMTDHLREGCEWYRDQDRLRKEFLE